MSEQLSVYCRCYRFNLNASRAAFCKRVSFIQRCKKRHFIYCNNLFFNNKPFSAIWINRTILNAAQTAIGNSKIILTSNIIGSIVNVILNAVLINGLLFFQKLEVAGAAIATSVSSFISLLIAVFYILRKNSYLKFNITQLIKPDFSIIKPLFKVTLSSMVEQLFIRIGLFTASRLVAELGTVEYAAHSICCEMLNLTLFVSSGFGGASSALFGQTLGKNRPDYTHIYYKIAQRLGLCFSVLFSATYLLAGKHIVGIFTADEPEAALIIKTGAVVLAILSVGTPAQSAQEILSNSLRGAGDTKFTAFLGLICFAFERPLLTYIFIYPLGLGVYGAWLSIVCDQFIRFIISSVYFRSGKWMKIKI